jgi:hypothetical protein
MSGCIPEAHSGQASQRAVVRTFNGSQDEQQAKEGPESYDTKSKEILNGGRLTTPQFELE